MSRELLGFIIWGCICFFVGFVVAMEIMPRVGFGTQTELHQNKTPCYTITYSTSSMATQIECVEIKQSIYGGHPYIRYTKDDIIVLIRPEIAVIEECEHE